MRQLVETKVLGMLNDIADDDMEVVETILDMDMGFWNADDGPAMSKETYTQVIKDCSNEELLELFGYLCFGG